MSDYFYFFQLLTNNFTLPLHDFLKQNMSSTPNLLEEDTCISANDIDSGESEGKVGRARVKELSMSQLMNASDASLSQIKKDESKQVREEKKIYSKQTHQSFKQQAELRLCCLIQSKKSQLSIFKLSSAPLQQPQTKQQPTMRKVHQSIPQITQNLRGEIGTRNMQRIGQQGVNQIGLYHEYRQSIEKVVQKGAGQAISFSAYKEILSIWYKLDEKKAVEMVGIDKFLKFGHLARLAPGRWLNDVIFSAYIKLLEALPQNCSTHHPTPFLIFDSLKVGAIFDQHDYTEIQRLLYKHRFQKYNTIPIFVINLEKHWIFTSVEFMKNRDKDKILVTVFDSLGGKDIKAYKKTKIFGKITAYFEYEYKTSSQIRICQNYPRQINGYDCGVIALCGIKDLVCQYLSWTFSSYEMNYRRALMTKELIQGQIIGR